MFFAYVVHEHAECAYEKESSANEDKKILRNNEGNFIGNKAASNSEHGFEFGDDGRNGLCGKNSHGEHGDRKSIDPCENSRNPKKKFSYKEFFEDDEKRNIDSPDDKIHFDSEPKTAKHADEKGIYYELWF